MHYLIYVSQAKHPMDPDELSGILEKSRIRNTKDGITGLLIYKFSPRDKRGNFMQLLEGEEEAIRAAFGRIDADPRHHTKIVLEEGSISERNFPDWSMGFRNVAPDDLKTVEGFSDLGEEAFWRRAEDGRIANALDAMKSFYEDAGLDD